MGFYVSDKTEYKHGIPSFEFIVVVDQKKGHKRLYTVFPKRDAFNSWDEQDRATESFRRIVWGLGKSPTLTEPFPAPIWHQHVKRFDVIPDDAVAKYNRTRTREEEEGDQQTNLFKQAVRMAKSVLTLQERLKAINRAERGERMKRPQQKPHAIIPKKGPGSYQRVKKFDIERPI